MMTQNNVLYVFVAKKAVVAVPVGTTSALTDGDVGIAKLDGTLVNALLTSGEKARIVKNNGGILNYSPIFTIDDITNKSAATFVADSMFVGFLGFNGVAGDISATTDTVYTPKLIVKGSLTTFGNKAFIKEAVYKTSKVAPVYKGDVVSGLVQNFDKGMAKEPEKYVTFDVTCSDAGAATILTTLTTGSRIAVVDAGTAVGDWIKDASGNAFKIVSLNNATEAVLDRKATENAAVTVPLLVVKATANNVATQWGIKFSGQPRTNFVAGLFKHMVYDFSILQGANFDNVSVTETHASLGTCTNEGVAEDEWFGQGNRGYGDRIDSIPVSSQVTAEMTGADYNGIYIKSKLTQFTNVLGQSPASLVEDKIYGSAALITGLKTVLGIV